MPDPDPAPPAPPVQGAPPAPPAAPPPEPKAVTMSLEAFNQRLQEATASGQKTLLKQVGFETPEALGAVLKVAKDAQQSQLTETQKLQQQIKELEPKVAIATELEPRFIRIVTAQFDALPENVRTAIDDVAKGDAAKRSDMIDVFRKAGMIGPTGASATAATGASGASGASGATGASQHPALANTTNAGNPPPPATTKSKFDEWQELEKTKPTQAQIFYEANRIAIEKSRPAET